MASVEQPILSRLDRLDNILKQLEEMRFTNHSPKSSCASTPSSGTLTSEGQASSVDFSPKSLEKHCRPIDDVINETEAKGTLIERLVHVEDRLLKLCVQLEEQLGANKKGDNMSSVVEEKKPSKKGFKTLMKSLIPGKGRRKNRAA